MASRSSHGSTHFTYISHTPFAPSDTFLTPVTEPTAVTRRLFGTLCGLVFLVNFGRTAFAPLVETFQNQLGASPEAVGLMTTLVWVGTALPRIPVGYLLTHIPRHRVVLGTGALLTVTAAFTATASSIRTVQVGAFGIGLASGAYFVAAVPLVGELYPDAVGRAIGVHGTAAQLAAVVAAPVVVTFVALEDWRTTFWLLAALAAAVTVVLAYTARGVDAVVETDTDRDFLGALRHWRLIFVGMLMISTAGFVWQGLFNFYVSYLVDAKPFTTAQASTMLTVVFAAGVPAFWLSGRLADRFPRVPYILVTLAVYVAALFALTEVSGYAPVLVVTAVLGYTIHSLFPALDSWVLDTLPAAVRSSAYAVFSGVSLLLEASGSGVVGFLTGYGYAFDTVFRTFAFCLAGVVAVLTLLYVTGQIPGTTRRASAI
ncbi:arabinose efflux permease [Halogeometricum borinquense DSM 11551]|uniref:Arabinose efflux permease n=1 Tax=Halogeometricum borinquense (strain ATCC 700274 / DSM 11551 / JCM 10706 / KCTC 4070 / PR3) TaxID=469382 RepID=L9UEG5_HALBP|nr:arabinose efflux permease [Halogeometricum borinquense DSM 11551]